MAEFVVEIKFQDGFVRTWRLKTDDDIITFGYTCGTALAEGEPTEDFAFRSVNSLFCRTVYREKDSKEFRPVSSIVKVEVLEFLDWASRETTWYEKDHSIPS